MAAPAQGAAHAAQLGLQDEGDYVPNPQRANATPSFEDLTFDDSLDDLHRIARYGLSAIALQRLVHVKMMADVATNEGYDKTKQFILPLIETLIQDEEVLVRQHTADQLRGIADVCVHRASETDGTTNAGYESLLDIILPALSKLLADSQPEVRVAAGETLVALAGWVKKEDLGPHVLTIILQMAHDEEQEELRMTAAVLLNELSETLGPELCHQFVTPEIICLAEDPVFKVRKAAALNLDAICRTAGPMMVVKRLLPAYLRLCSDDIWGVRKACAESLVSVSKSLDPATRASDLIPVCDRLVNDVSKWVRTAALQSLGAFIATLPSNKVTPGLLAHYVRMGLSPEGALAQSALTNSSGQPIVASANSSSGGSSSSSSSSTGSSTGASPTFWERMGGGGAVKADHSSSSSNAPGAASSAGGATTGAGDGSASKGSSKAGGGASPSDAALMTPSTVTARLGTDPGDSDLASYCAFSFPAVVLKLGRTRWPELRQLFTSLSRDVQRKVRKPLSHALHELARILGPELAEAELLPAFDLFLKDPADEVKAGVVKNISCFLAALSLPTRESYLPVLDETAVTAGPLNWRFRHMMASQLPLLAQIFSPAATFSVVAPFTIRLLNDPIAIVREEAAAGVSPLLNRLAASSIEPALQVEIMARLLKLATAPCYRDRLQFLRLCGYLGNATTGIDPAAFRAHFLSPMLALAKDPVRNVRHLLSELMAPISTAAEVLLGAAAPLGSGSASSSSSSFTPLRPSHSHYSNSSSGSNSRTFGYSSDVSAVIARSSSGAATFHSSSSSSSSSPSPSAGGASGGAGSHAASASSSSSSVSAIRSRAVTLDMPLGLSEDLMPQWAWQQAPQPSTSAAAGDNSSAGEAAPSAAVATGTSALGGGLGLALSAEVLAALDSLANDDDTETATSLAAGYLASHRTKPLKVYGGGANGSSANASGGAGASEGAGAAAGGSDDGSSASSSQGSIEGAAAGPVSSSSSATSADDAASSSCADVLLDLQLSSSGDGPSPFVDGSAS